MAIRKDGVDRCNVLLKAALEVFSEKGYRNTTVAEICSRAKSNVAAVNYHFGSKDKLYAAVWKKAFDEALEVYPLSGGLPADASAEQKLEAVVYSLVHRFLDDGRLGRAGQILLREMAESTEAVQQILSDIISPLQRQVGQIIKELLGENASQQQVAFCRLSLINQCIALGFRKSKGKLPPVLGKGKLVAETIDELVEHITLFTLAGIAAVKNKIRNK
ncbi:MAG: CerR family C-terminal domain-containing protein [Planctomycetes bacterium]|nr:CerR family C-terminal domain-containing protein [Planctomycetota bacterium]